MFGKPYFGSQYFGDRYFGASAGSQPVTPSIEPPYASQQAPALRILRLTGVGGVRLDLRAGNARVRLIEDEKIFMLLSAG